MALRLPLRPLIRRYGPNCSQSSELSNFLQPEMSFAIASTVVLFQTKGSSVALTTNDSTQLECALILVPVGGNASGARANPTSTTWS